jgi:hypothetical protein
VTPAKSGYSFSPTSVAVTVNGANATAGAMAATAETWTITGGVGASGSGATIALTGTSTATTTASASGAYTFSGLANGTYTVTPSLSGYTFNPASVGVTVNGANATAATMQAVANGSGTAFVTADAALAVRNNYAGWVGMELVVGVKALTVSSVGRMCVTGNSATHTVQFSNASTGQALSGGSAAVNMAGCTPGQFVYAPLAASITLQPGVSYYLASQEVAGGDTWCDLGAVITTLDAVVTDAAYNGGTWVAIGLANTSYGPPNFEYTVAGQTWTISGSVGTTGSGSTISVTGTSTATATANASGAYTVTGLANGSYTVTPILTGYTFNPVNQAVTVTGANVTAVNFTATAVAVQTWSITGSVGASGSGATIYLTGTSTASTTANGSGAYTFSGLANGSYTVTPSLNGYSFNPASVGVTVNGANATAAAMVATAQTWGITGGVGTAGSGATISLTGASTASTTANSSGAYAFTGLPNGSYTLTASLAGYSFSPASVAVTINGANATAAAMTATAEGSATAFITAFGGVTPRNNYTGWVGTVFTVGANSLTVSSVGRTCLAGNTGTHTVKFVVASTGQAVAGGTEPVNMAGCTPGQFVYASLPASIILQAGVSYYLASQEAAGADTWYDIGSVSTTPVAAVTGAAYNGGSWSVVGLQNAAYGPPNFQYATAAGSSGGTVYITGYSVTGRAVRNNYAGWVGTEMRVGSNALTVNSVGRLCLAGNAGTHTVEFASVSTGQTVSGGSAAVNMAGCTPGQFVYSSLPTSIILTAGASYYLASQEVAGGDTWYDIGAVATTSDAVLTDAAYNGGSWISIGESGAAFGPPNFEYTVTASGTPFVTSYAGSSDVRNDYTSFVGTQLTVGASSLTVTSVGRLCLAGNSATHAVKFANASTGQDIPGGSAVVNMAGCTPGQFVYAALTTPIVLQPGASYDLGSMEVGGGDTWYNTAGVTTTADASITNSAYYNGYWISMNTANTAYVPVNFQYHH